MDLRAAQKEIEAKIAKCFHIFFHLEIKNFKFIQIYKDEKYFS